jgi:succinate dehydrogenase / fumarate reductase, cytochrome b subunit
MKNNNPLSPHIQIYRWHISSLISITHRITGIVNISAITVICFWIFSLLLGENSYDLTKLFLQSFFGKFIIICLTWSFSFQTLSEIRHLIMDLGYGFELNITKVTGLIVIFGSFCLTILFYLLGRNFI